MDSKFFLRDPLEASPPVLKGTFLCFVCESTQLARRVHKTHTDGGAVIRKPGSAWLEGTPAVSIIFMFGFMIVDL